MPLSSMTSIETIGERGAHAGAVGCARRRRCRRRTCRGRSRRRARSAAIAVRSTSATTRPPKSARAASMPESTTAIAGRWRTPSSSRGPGSPRRTATAACSRNRTAHRSVGRDRPDVRPAGEVGDLAPCELSRHAADRLELLPQPDALAGVRLARGSDLGGHGRARLALRALDDDVEGRVGVQLRGAQQTRRAVRLDARVEARCPCRTSPSRRPLPSAPPSPWRRPAWQRCRARPCPTGRWNGSPPWKASPRGRSSGCFRSNRVLAAYS